MDRIDITHDELLEAVRSALGSITTSDGITAPELATLLDVLPTTTFGARLRTLVSQGKLRPVWVRRTDSWGRQTRRPGYALPT